MRTVNHINEDTADYQRFLAEYGFTEDLLAPVVNNLSDQIPMPAGFEQIELRDSPIHGKGLFATRHISSGELIAPARLSRKRTPAGRYTNHSTHPNAKFVRVHDAPDGDLHMVAVLPIAPDDEVCINYRQAGAVNGNGRFPLPAEVQETARLKLLSTSLQHPHLGVAPFGSGDAFGESRRASSLQDSNEQLAMMPEGSVRERLYTLQKAIGDLPDVEMPLQHTFAPGVYVRTIFIPAGTVLVGKIHKHQHANILSQGHVTVLTEAGGTEELHGPITLVSEPGTKRAVFAHTDTVWTTIHPTDKTDLGQIEEETISPNYAEYEKFIEGKTL